MSEEQVTLEEQLAELKDIVQKLSDPKLPLDDSVKLFERGVILSGKIEERINAYELKVQMLSQEDTVNG